MMYEWTQPDPAPWFSPSAGALEAARQAGANYSTFTMDIAQGGCVD